MTSRQLKVLYVGGTGTISASCVRASAERGSEVFVLNRGRSASARPLPESVTFLSGDIGDQESVRAAIGSHTFDAVVNFLCYTAEQADAAVGMFGGRTNQYVHISTAAMYHKPVRRLPFVESTPRHNPFSRYARDKIAAEDALLRAFADMAFPVTIVRPSHTYDQAQPPLPGDWTVVDRICRGAEIAVPGDGTSMWTLTHASDFAQGLVGLLGNPLTIGESFHITSDDVYSWNQIYETIALAAGVPARLVHVPSEFLTLAAPDWMWTELIVGDLQYSVLLDNTKIRRYVPTFAPRISFTESVPQMLRWREEHSAQTRPDPKVDDIYDRLVSGYHEAVKIFEALAPGNRA
jgi:nucleoside-diphosphate-sugar epimerase